MALQEWEKPKAVVIPERVRELPISRELFPPEYRVTDVMTSMVSNDGVVYQRDLGPNTLELAKKIDRFNPGKELGSRCGVEKTETKAQRHKENAAQKPINCGVFFPDHCTCRRSPSSK